jgi:hypothetical protein
MPKYIITFTKQEANALFEYNDEGFLMKYELTPGTFDKLQFAWLFSRFPRTLELLEKWKVWNVPNVTIKKVEEDLSFQRFYDLYDHKISKRSRAETAWNALSRANKALAIAYLPKYEAHLRKTSQNKKYPETYLNSEAWNN